MNFGQRWQFGVFLGYVTVVVFAGFGILDWVTVVVNESLGFEEREFLGLE